MGFWYGMYAVSLCDCKETWLQRMVHAIFVPDVLTFCTPGHATAGTIQSRGVSSRGQGRRGNQSGGRFVTATGGLRSTPFVRQCQWSEPFVALANQYTARVSTSLTLQMLFTQRVFLLNEMEMCTV